MKYDSFFPFHVTPTAGGWSIDERTNYGTTLRQRIIEFDDRDGFCNDIYEAGYGKGVRDEKFYI